MAGSSDHVAAATLEAYSLQDLTVEAVETVENHLLVCETCRTRLAGIEPFNTVHYTQDGPFYSRVTRLRNGVFAARHWGCQIDGGRRCDDLASACKYLVESFAQMFPEHKCVEGCGDTRETLGPSSSDWIS
jgi:hypothetical protein